MTLIVIVFFALSLLLYVLFGGADFGAGIIEIFSDRRDRRAHEELIAKSMGPVWEANHMWLIIAVVILFNGFSEAYAVLSIYFHVPLTIMLIGIIFRGCAFAFRHYDAIQDGTRRVYTAVFDISSVITPLLFGMMVGALVLGRLDVSHVSYADLYLWPWCNGFSLCVGVFVVVLFAFIAASFLIGECRSDDFRRFYIQRAKIAHILTIVFGGIVFVMAELCGLHLFRQYWDMPMSFLCVALATMAVYFIWRNFHRHNMWTLRFWVGFQVTMILSAWFWLRFPTIMQSASGELWTFYSTAGPDRTMRILAWALMVGSVLFLPMLFYLYRVFKARS